MAKTTIGLWNPDFFELSPLYFPLRAPADSLSRRREAWPELDDYQALLAQQRHIATSMKGAAIRFVPQAEKSSHWLDDYEPRIYLTGEVQTRLHNWHDFFQVLVWSTFPETKAVLNAKHYWAIRKRKATNPDNPRRTPLENALTQFDECGAIVVSSEPHLLQCIREFRWKELFWRSRETVKNQLQCFVFGHAMYEKALAPYIGMTAHAILLLVEPEFFGRPMADQLAHLDERAAEAFEQNRFPDPGHFQPFPLLGMPGWDRNDTEAYYDNSDYFRAGRKGQSHG